MRVSEERYQNIALADPEGHWELDCGRLRSKPDMTTRHNYVAHLLGVRLQTQLDRYDARRKLPQYQQRGDLEIWYIQPHEHTLTVWQRQPDGSYAERLYTSGIVQLFALPNVAIDLEELFNV